LSKLRVGRARVSGAKQCNRNGNRKRCRQQQPV
jgi:hypothetical protein